jgi:hypothetical protein
VPLLVDPISREVAVSGKRVELSRCGSLVSRIILAFAVVIRTR